MRKIALVKWIKVSLCDVAEAMFLAGLLKTPGALKAKAVAGIKDGMPHGATCTGQTVLGASQ